MKVSNIKSIRKFVKLEYDSNVLFHFEIGIPTIFKSSNHPIFKLLLGIFLLCNLTIVSAQRAIIPQPVELKPGVGAFVISQKTSIDVQHGLNKEAELLKVYVRDEAGINLRIDSSFSAGSFVVKITIDSGQVLQPEGYELIVTDKTIVLTGHDAAGVFFGIQTLRQLMQVKGKGIVDVEACSIKDYPRFGYRGMHLDVSRHFFSVDFIKRYIDLLALYKFNTFHWHLTDDQGWRIEIKKYPRLQSIAAWRDETLIGHKKELPHTFDGKKYGGFYTQEQIKQVVAYAQDRHINIIPEIEMPGHALAVLAAYPSLGCTGGLYKTATFWGVFDDVFCAGNDSTFLFLQNVLDEVIALFPSKYIHIGGDECPKVRWNECPKCKKRMQNEHLADANELQSYFVRRIEAYVTGKGKQVIGWDEILEGGLTPGATVMSWRGEEGGIAAAKQKHQVIMTPESNLYFDYYQSLYPEEKVAAGGYTPLQKVYAYEPAAEHTDSTFLSYIKGIQGQAWSEYLTSEGQAEYMIFPRAIALAEVAWSALSARDYDNFLLRLKKQEKLLSALKVNYAKSFDEITYAATSSAGHTIEIALTSTLKNAQILYTVNNTSPNLHSLAYSKPLLLDSSCTVKAALFIDKKQTGRVFKQTFILHKAEGANVILENQPIEKYNPGAKALVNGILGTDRYNDNQWVGFSATDLSATIDLGQVLTIKKLATNILNYKWQRMWPPVSLRFLVSVDGTTYKKVYEQNNFPVNGINKVNAVINPVSARFVKVIGINKGIIPGGEYGAGGKALLMIDEIIVD
ncbi:family 20 glycosylhydrolase [Chitinophagaceae bacterium LWZ2-11]